MLGYDRERAFMGRWIGISVFVTPVLLLVSRIDEVAGIFRREIVPTSGWTGQFIMETLQGDILLFFLPILCALPYASSFIDEVKSGIVRFILIRIRRSRYFLSKAAAAALSGGTAAAVGILAFIAAAFVLFLPLEDGNWKRELTEILPQCGQVLCQFFCIGALWAECGLCFSTLFHNRYIAWLSPFMAEYLLVILCERYIPWCRIFYPAEWLNPRTDWPWNGWSAVLWMTALTAVFALIFLWAAERRLGHVQKG